MSYWRPKALTGKFQLYGPLLFLAGLLAACGAPSAPPAAPPSPAPTTVAQPTSAPQPTAQPTPAVKKSVGKAKLAFPTNSITAFIYFLGKEKGYYADEGLDLSVEQIPSGVAIRGMVAGEIEFTSATGTALSSIVSGAPLKNLFISTHGPVAWFYAKKEIKTVADLKGKNIAIAATGDFSHNLAKTALAAGGLNPDTDVVYVASPGASANRLRAVVAGAADAAILTPPENLIADQEKLTNLAFLGGGKFNLVTDGAGTTDQLIKEKPEVVRAFVRGSLKALKLFKTKKSEVVPLLAQFLKINADQASSLYDTASGAFTDDGLESEAALQKAIEDQKQLNKVDKDIPVNQAFDLSFTRKANDELKQENWKP